MALHKIKDFDPEYSKHFDDRDVKGMDLYVADDKVGSVDDILVDDSGQFRYLVINTGVWILGKKVLLPIGRAQIDYQKKRVYGQNLTKSQVESLPELTEDMAVDYDHEERVRGVYRASMPATPTMGVGKTPTKPVTTGTPMLGVEDEYAEPAGYVYDRDTYSHDKEPDLYAMNEDNHPNLKLYEERLVASKQRQKAGDAVISKRIETETVQASVPIEKERVTIERVPVSGATAVAPGEATFQAGEVSRVDVYEEVAEFHKEAFVREEVRVNKVVEKETATAQEQIRREEVDIKIDGRPTGTDGKL
ncbi:DUF2382 domain-containing protein [Chamaesiphon sp. GL140_3_metabinner_50]|uniref:DUF2382 domain-containing protein n=1 Tax=Chamaesiphon sp. GL140_3_metabinner_50 TaxID=2970812 RepID=UPI0025F85896|nr:DUF2382 domain-containing protein [Chamaesiphon sp. GL140_3_metabinner_50]